MNTLEVLARLTAHWPQLGGDDARAEIRMEDWARVIERSSPAVRAETVEILVTGWTGDWHPKIGDWQETARQVATRHELQRPAIESGAPSPEERARVHALIEQTRQMLIDKNRHQPAKVIKRVSKYDSKLPVFAKNEMSNEEHAAEVAAFGARKVRRKEIR